MKVVVKKEESDSGVQIGWILDSKVCGGEKKNLELENQDISSTL